MMKAKTIVSSVTLFCFMLAQADAARAQSAAATTTINTVAGLANEMVALPSATFGQQPQQMSLGSLATTIQDKMNLCQAQFALTPLETSKAGSVDALIKSMIDKRASTTKKDSKEKTAANTQSPECTDLYTGGKSVKNMSQEAVCALNCSGPDINVRPNNKACEYTKIKPLSGTSSLGTQLNAAESFADYLDVKAVCDTADFATFKKQTDLFQCQMAAMQEGVQLATSQIQNTLVANGKAYEQMNTYENEVQKQVTDIEKILGPDPKLGGSGSAQFSGLLGLQAKLKKDLTEKTTASAQFSSAATQVVNDYAENDQVLDAGRVQVMGNCLVGQSVTNSKVPSCYVDSGKVGNTGHKIYVLSNKCTVKQYLESQARNEGLLSNNGIKDEASYAVAQRLEDNVDQVLSNIQAKFNTVSQSTDASGKSSAQVSNLPVAYSWADIEKENKNAINSLSPALAASLRKQGLSCTNDSNTWKLRQQQFKGSDWNKNKLKLDARKKELSAQLTNGLADLNEDYGQAIAGLTGAPATLNRYSCTTDDPVQMGKCMDTIISGLRDTLEGNGVTALLSIQNIQGGSLVPAIQFSCKGVNGCVTDLTAKRKTQMQLADNAHTAKQAFAKTGNNQVTDQVKAFADQLRVAQMNLDKQFAAFTGGPTKKLQGDKLVAAKVGGRGSEETGPFELPSGADGMNGVLSGMMGGLTDAKDPGIKDALDGAKEKMAKAQEKAADKAKSYRDLITKISDQKDKCQELVLNKLDDCDLSSKLEEEDKSYFSKEKDPTGVLKSLSAQLSSLGTLVSSMKSSDDLSKSWSQLANNVGLVKEKSSDSKQAIWTPSSRFNSALNNCSALAQANSKRGADPTESKKSDDGSARKGTDAAD